MALARRKKPVTIDGAEFLISPLTYQQIEQYAEKQADVASADLNDKSVQSKARNNVFFVICCGLNNAGLTPALEASHLFEELDDVLATRLWREILEFTGIKIPSDEELTKLTAERIAKSQEAAPEGEKQASS